jgi:hypothetical protein
MSVFMSSIETFEYSGSYKEAGYNVRLLRDKSPKARKAGGAVVLLKGGLGDPNSKTVVCLAKALLEVSDAELTVGTVSTTRPKNVIKAAAGLSRSRKHQSQSIYGASNYVNDNLHPEALFLAGQSRGTVSVVDGAIHLATHPKKNEKSPSIGVATIDGPGVFQELDYDGNVVQGLFELGTHCLEDVRKLKVIDRLKLYGSIAANTSLYEVPYFLSDVLYLKHIGIDQEVNKLRDVHKIPVTHIFHQNDLIPGAEFESEHSVVLEGGHARFLRDPYPVAEVIYDRTMAVLNGAT